MTSVVSAAAPLTADANTELNAIGVEPDRNVDELISLASGTKLGPYEIEPVIAASIAMLPLRSSLRNLHAIRSDFAVFTKERRLSRL